jgi:hypothetical protein
MRENRPYGSEGGESGSTGLPYPYREKSQRKKGYFFRRRLAATPLHGQCLGVRKNGIIVNIVKKVLRRSSFSWMRESRGSPERGTLSSNPNGPVPACNVGRLGHPKPLCFSEPARLEKRLDFRCATRNASAARRHAPSQHGRYRLQKQLAINAGSAPGASAKTDVAAGSRATSGYLAIVAVNSPCTCDTTVWHVGRKVQPSTYDLLP